MDVKAFKAYPTSVNDDGTVNIHGVEIFELGNHKGFNYDKDWAKKAIQNFQALKEKGFLPSVIIGHNDGKEEKPARGFMDNLTIEGDVIKADIVKVPQETFEELKKRAYPHRSVEVNSEEARFTALALLGGTSPYHKLPIMEFGEDPKNTVIHFQADEIDLEAAVELESKIDKVRKIWWKMMDFIDSILFNREKSEGDKTAEIKDLLQQGAKLLGEEVNNFKEEKTMQFTEEQKRAIIEEQTKQFQEKYGMTPEEAAKAAIEFQEREKKRLEKERQDKIAAFAEKLKKEKSVRPALVDEAIVPFLQSLNGGTVKFSENGQDVEKPQVEFFQSLVEKLVDAAEEGKLFVPFSETVEGVQYKPGEIFTENDYDAQKLDAEAQKLAKKFMEEGKFKSFDEAYQKAVFELTKNV